MTVNENTMSLRDQAIRGVFWSAIQNWGSALLGVCVFIVLAHLLDAEAFGLLALANIAIVFMEIFQRQGFGLALVQRSEIEPAHLDTAFWINIVMGILLTALGVSAAGFGAALFDSPELAPVIRWLSLSLLIGALSGTPQAILRRKMAFKSLAIRSLVGVTGGGVVGISMALSGCGVWSLVAQHLTAAAIGTVVLWSASGFRPGFNVSMRHFRDLFSFGVHILASEIVGVVSRSADRLLIGLFLGMTAVGYYEIALRLLTLMTQVLTQTVSTVAFATFSRLQHATDQMRHAFCTATRMTSAIAFPAFLGMAVLAPELVHGLFGDQWEPSIPVMRVLAFVGILQSIAFFNGSVLMACGKPQWRLALISLNALVNVIAFLVVVRWGILAVAAAFVIRAYVLFPLTFLAAGRLIALRPITYLQPLAAPLAASLIMVVVVSASKHFLGGTASVHLTLGVGIILGIVTYALAIHWFAPELAGQLRDFARTPLTGKDDLSRA